MSSSVRVLTITQGDTTETVAAPTHQRAIEHLYEFVSKRWTTLFDEPGDSTEVPADRETAIRTYFERSQDDDYTLVDTALLGGSHTSTPGIGSYSIHPPRHERRTPGPRP